MIGRVRLKNNVSVWFNAVVRGDDEPLVVGENSNVQDCAVLPTDPGNSLVLGTPGRVKQLSAEAIAGMQRNYQHYVENGKWFNTALSVQEEADRP